MEAKTMFELQFGFTSEDQTKVYTYERDRYGAKEKKRLQVEADWKEIREAEKKLFSIPSKDRLHNQWWECSSLNRSVLSMDDDCSKRSERCAYKCNIL